MKALPPQLIEQIVDTWASWPLSVKRRPELIDTAIHSGNGSTNNVYKLLVEHTEGKLPVALRIHDDQFIGGLSRAEEKRIHDYASSKQLAPSYLFASSLTLEDGSLVSYSLIEWLEASPRKTLTSKEKTCLVHAIAEYQQAQPNRPNAPTLNYVEAIDRYASTSRNLTSKRHMFEHAKSVAHEFESRYGSNRTLTHNDLNPGNILWPDKEKEEVRCWIIDWEFAGLGIPSFDFASVSVEFAVDSNELSSLAGIEFEELQHAIHCYRSLCEVYQIAMQPK